MKDRVAANPNRYAVYDDDHNFLRYEYHERADNPTEVGTPLSKANLLPDASAAAFSPDAPETVGAALALLGRLNAGLGNEYVWEKNKHIENWTEYETVNLCASNGNTTIYYGTTKALGNQKACGSVSQFTSACAGFYFKIYGSDTLYYGDPNGTCTISNGYFVFPAKTFISESDEISYVNSPDPNAYPPTVSDGYNYTLLGQIGNKLQIATGSYTGTRTHGSSNQNSITFPFTPKMVFIEGYDVNSVFYPWGSTTFFVCSNDYRSYCTVSVSGNTMTWYTDDNSIRGDILQLNGSHSYHYVGIG